MGITCWIFCGKNRFSTPSSGLNVWYQGKRTHWWNPFPHPSFHPSSYFRSGIGNQGPLLMDGLFPHLYACSHSTFLKTFSCLQIWAGPLLDYPIQKFLVNSAQRNSKGLEIWCPFDREVFKITIPHIFVCEERGIRFFCRNSSGFIRSISSRSKKEWSSWMDVKEISLGTSNTQGNQRLIIGWRRGRKELLSFENTGFFERIEQRTYISSKVSIPNKLSPVWSTDWVDEQRSNLRSRTAGSSTITFSKL